MFVKVLWNDGVESIYECSSAHYKPVDGKTARVMMTGAVIENFDVERKGNNVFLLNNEGRTIDHYLLEAPLPS